MIHDVISATHIADYKIEVSFDDGKSGVVDFSKYLESDGVFEAFADNAFFRSFQVSEELGTLVWGDEIDIAPESLYAAATGDPLPDWMTIDTDTKRAV